MKLQKLKILYALGYCLLPDCMSLFFLLHLFLTMQFIFHSQFQIICLGILLFIFS